MPSGWRGLAWIFSLCVALVLLLIAGQAKAAGLTGKYDGSAAAVGMSLSLQEVAGRLVGRLETADGRIYALNGTPTKAAAGKAGAEGELRSGGAAEAVAYFRIEDRPPGLQFLFIPVRSDGKPDMPSAHDYSFLAQGVDVAVKADAVAVPRKMDLLHFIDEYRQRDVDDVGLLYQGLSERDKALIGLYDHASADILWRICATDPPNAKVPQSVLDEVLDRQQTRCEVLMPVVRRAQAGGLFSEFLRRARFQFEIIREMSLCNSGQSSPEKCADASALGAPLIVHWRSAMSIMRELASGGGADISGAPVAVAPTTAEMKITVPPLRDSLVDAPVEHRAAAIIKSEGRTIARMRRYGLYLPLSSPRD
jgi:hypothetical protein